MNEPLDEWEMDFFLEDYLLDEALEVWRMKRDE